MDTWKSYEELQESLPFIIDLSTIEEAFLSSSLAQKTVKLRHWTTRYIAFRRSI
jgi:hypothetical protein